MMHLPSTLLALSLCWIASVEAQITIYGQIPFGLTQSQSSGAAPTPTAAAFAQTTLTPPPVPQPQPQVAFSLSLPRNAADVPGLSIPHTDGSFYGLSIEMSVTNQVLGKNSSFLQVPFLNLLANLADRAGYVPIRLGGNTQEDALLVDSLPNGRFIAKLGTHDVPTDTPVINYTEDFFYIANNVSTHVNVRYFLGLPFNDTTNIPLEIMELGQAILGDKVLAWQAGNEPDLYGQHGRRKSSYAPSDYFGEVGSVIAQINADGKIPVKTNILLGPSVASVIWTPEMVWDTGFIQAYTSQLYALTVEHYPNNNCAVIDPALGPVINPQDIFPSYLTHQSAVGLVRPYLNSSQIAQVAGKPFIMFETNTASCGGFPGVSDTFGAALWAIDYGFQMAYSNFSNAMLHNGGQNVNYNAFTAPPTNTTAFNEWTVGSIFYSIMVIAEAFGKSNTSQVFDVEANAGNEFTPAYSIYENGELSKVALINFLDDKTGASDIVASITVPGGGVPGTVSVKYLAAESVSVNNITWAGQTFGGLFEVDGRLRGTLNVTTVSCDLANNVCKIPVPAPGFALVFLDADPVLQLGQSPETFSTSVATKTQNTVAVDPKVLATSNGHSAKDLQGMGSTSHESIPSSGNGLYALIPFATTLFLMAAGANLVIRG